MSLFEGAGVAMITPMNKKGNIDYDKLEELIERQIKNHTDALFICCTTGEAATMTEEEHIGTIRFAVNRVKGRIPVIAGTGSNNTAHSVQMSIYAEKAGADGVLLVSPYYNKATQKGMEAHFTAIAESIKIPSILYNVPSRTGCSINPQTVASLFKNVDNIIGIKEASGNISNTAEIMNLCDGKIDIYSGNDDQIVPILSLGGKGVVSVLSNVVPKYVHDMISSYLNGDIKKAAQMQIDCIPLCNALFCEVNPIPVKAALNDMGLEVGTPRLPLCDIEPHNNEIVKKAIMDFRKFIW